MMFKPILALMLLVSTVVSGNDPQSEYISHKISKRYLTHGYADKEVDAARTMTARNRLALMQRDLMTTTTSNFVEHVVVSGELSNLIVNLHNDLRATVMPPATDMQDMTWSDDIAQHAAEWAQCGEHFNQHREDDNNLNNYGENLFVLETSASYTASLEKKIMIGLNIWWNEKENYNFDDNSCIHDTTCGHYKQMAWAESNVIGCGYALNCPIEGKPWFTSSFYLVCNYSPQGNMNGQKPYTRTQASVPVTGTFGGTAKGANCLFPFTYQEANYNECIEIYPGEMPWCKTDNGNWGYCTTVDCAVQECQNGGTLDECACKCAGGWTGGDCAVCSITECKNGGAFDLASCSCTCPTGYGGVDCGCFENPSVFLFDGLGMTCPFQPGYNHYCAHPIRGPSMRENCPVSCRTCPNPALDGRE